MVAGDGLAVHLVGEQHVALGGDGLLDGDRRVKRLGEGRGRGGWGGEGGDGGRDEGNGDISTDESAW